jgi:hypothetical protein
MKKFLIIIFAVLIAAVVYSIWPEKELRHQPGILVAQSPVQKNMTVKRSWIHNEFTFTELAEFELKGRVLGVCEYSTGKESEISPVDFAMGWGPMSDQSVLDNIDIAQRNRWYYWKTDSYPIPKQNIISNSANMHIIPANAEIENQIDKIYSGCVIEISGYLVEIIDGKGWRWKSSLTRNDAGNGSCEVIWVEKLNILIGE